MYMYVCIYIYIYAHILVCMYVCIYIYIYTHLVVKRIVIRIGSDTPSRLASWTRIRGKRLSNSI